MLSFYNHVIWFKVCRPLRYKYHLSVNCLLILSGCYVYNTVIGLFTLTNIVKFLGFFSSNRTRMYLTVLVSNGFIVVSGSSYNKPAYKLSKIGLTVIQELNSSYEIELSKFCNTYNIVL
jgi:hypothetical protein